MPVIKEIKKLFPEIEFETFELEHDEDLCAYIDFFAFVGKKSFGIEIKPGNLETDYHSYFPSERMESSFADFTKKFGGKVFIVFSIDDKIQNKEVIEEIRQEIERLKNLDKI